MSNNFYVKPEDKCRNCQRDFEGIHLGKSSMGWAFMLQYNDGVYYKNWDEMKTWISDKRLVDEYDNEISVKEFIELVEYKKDIQDPEPANYGERLKKINGYKFLNSNFC